MKILAKGTYQHSINFNLVYIKDKEYDSAGYAQITISRHLIDFTSRSLVTFLLSLITLARLFYPLTNRLERFNPFLITVGVDRLDKVLS